jgi:hypothetical protein
MNYGGADVGDDELWIRDERITEERENGLHTAPRNEREPDLRAVAEEAVESQAVGLSAAEERSVEVCCQKKDFG